MIAADTSAWVDYSNGVENRASNHLASALADGTLLLPIPVLFEFLSDPKLTAEARKAVLALPKLDLLPGYWERAAELRAALLKKKLRANSLDCLIAQNCIDYDLVLIAADEDFRHFVKHGLKLI